MPKVSTGRLDGVWGMESFTVEELYAWADKFDAQIHERKGNPANLPETVQSGST
jgi:hypothetical protein